MSQVAGVSPVNCMELRRSDHGPIGLAPKMPDRSAPPMRANEKPRTPRLLYSSAYAWLIRLSGPTCGSLAVDAPQNVQASSHQVRTPCCSNGRCRFRYALRWAGLDQSKYGSPSTGSPPAWLLAVAYLGSFVAIDGWMFSVTDRPCWAVQFRNPCGSGNSALFQFQPFHWLGDFQSVSTTSQSSGT